MDDRDHFAAAALTGLLAQGDDGSFSEESYARGAYRWADVMLSVRDSQTADKPVTEPMPKEKLAEVSDTEPVAWAVMDGSEAMEFCIDKEEAKGALAFYGAGTVVPLYRYAQPTITAAERSAIADAADRYAEMTPESAETAAILRGLLKRLA